ncbi:MAG: nitrogen regulation protein NR(II) [Terriglobia bacterium]
MGRARQLRDWLSWLLRVRFLVLLVLLGIELAIRQFAPSPVPIKYFISLLLLWFTLAIFYAILRGLELDPHLEAYVELTVDLALVTGIVYVTGALDSYFLPLYILLIIVASILLSHVGAFLLSALSYLLLAGVVNAAYVFSAIPVLYPQNLDAWSLQVYLMINLFAFVGTWYLASRLAESLRRAGVQLEDTAVELKQLQAFNENIIQSMRGGLLTTDLEGRVLLLNPAGAEILETSEETLRGVPLADYFPGLAVLLFQPGGPAPVGRQELRVRAADGSERMLGATVSALRTREGTDSGYVFSFQDLTELKRLETEVANRERMAVLGRLAAALAHEIRNPLGAIAGSMRQLTRFAQVGDDEQQLVDVVSRESERLNRLVNDILGYSRQKVPQRERTSLAPLLEETLLLLERHPQFSRQVQVEKRLPSGGVNAHVDPGQMRQLLWNLCDNALRAMPGGGTLRVGLEEANGVVRIQVADTGIGLTPEQCEKIFEPFESSFGSGTGLGLAIVYQIVTGHGGRVWARPRRPRGSKFTVELPRD